MLICFFDLLLAASSIPPRPSLRVWGFLCGSFDVVLMLDSLPLFLSFPSRFMAFLVLEHLVFQLFSQLSRFGSIDEAVEVLIINGALLKESVFHGTGVGARYFFLGGNARGVVVDRLRWKDWHFFCCFLGMRKAGGPAVHLCHSSSGFGSFFDCLSRCWFTCLKSAGNLRRLSSVSRPLIWLNLGCFESGLASECRWSSLASSEWLLSDENWVVTNFVAAGLCFYVRPVHFISRGGADRCQLDFCHIIDDCYAEGDYLARLSVGADCGGGLLNKICMRVLRSLGFYCIVGVC